MDGRRGDWMEGDKRAGVRAGLDGVVAEGWRGLRGWKDRTARTEPHKPNCKKNRANRNRGKTHPRNRNEPKRTAALLIFKHAQLTTSKHDCRESAFRYQLPRTEAQNLLMSEYRRPLLSVPGSSPNRTLDSRRHTALLLLEVPQQNVTVLEGPITQI